MYANHQPRIAAYARERPEHLARVLWLALLSAHMQWYRVPGILESVERGEPGASTNVRLAAVTEIWQRREEIAAQCADIAYHADNWDGASVDMVAYLSSLPCLGLVKAGFAAAMAFGLSGCIDRHNAERLGTHRDAFQKYHRRTVRGRRAIVTRYHGLIRAGGGTAKLWDDWCEHMHTVDPARYPSPWHASALHCIALDLPAQQERAVVRKPQGSYNDVKIWMELPSRRGK